MLKCICIDFIWISLKVLLIGRKVFLKSDKLIAPRRYTSTRISVLTPYSSQIYSSEAASVPKNCSRILFPSESNVTILSISRPVGQDEAAKETSILFLPWSADTRNCASCSFLSSKLPFFIGNYWLLNNPHVIRCSFPLRRKTVIVMTMKTLWTLIPLKLTCWVT